jgi:phage terminase small subunit
MPKTVGLTDKEAAFIREYLVDKNITQAAIRAGYSVRTAAKIGSEVFARPRVQAALRKALKEQERRTLIAADQVLLDINDLANKAARAGEYHAAIRGKELIGKHYKLFTEKHEHGGIGGGPVMFQISEAEAAH